jgi:hypothetical protein
MKSGGISESVKMGDEQYNKPNWKEQLGGAYSYSRGKKKSLRGQGEKIEESERCVPVKDATFLADMPSSVCEFWSAPPL